MSACEIETITAGCEDGVGVAGGVLIRSGFNYSAGKGVTHFAAYLIEFLSCLPRTPVCVMFNYRAFDFSPDKWTCVLIN